MSNVRFYPDEDIKEFRFDDDVEYLVVSEENWKSGVVFGFSTHYYSEACMYAKDHKDTNWIITLI